MAHVRSRPLHLPVDAYVNGSEARAALTRYFRLYNAARASSLDYRRPKLLPATPTDRAAARGLTRSKEQARIIINREGKLPYSPARESVQTIGAITPRKAMITREQHEFTVEDLPRFSPWPARLLGLAEWQQRKKTSTEVTREFDREKWGKLLDRYRANGGKATIDIVEAWMLESIAPSLCTIGDRFELLTAAQALHRHHEVVAQTLHDLLPAKSIVELGAGFGSVIMRLAVDSRFHGASMCAAEFSNSGVELMRQLAASAGINLPIGHCDLSSDALTDLFVPDGSIVFTCMAAHYVPHIEDKFVTAFCEFRPKAVVHFEPCYEHCDPQTLTGALRRRYIELNDYNRNLISLLHQHAAAGAIRIVKEVPAVIGVNPLLPISILVWEPRGEGNS